LQPPHITMGKFLPKAIAVVGPTAVGKTKLGVTLANLFEGEIVSADSRQVYKYLDISTGKDKNEYVISNYKLRNTCIPYHLIDILEPTEEITVADFQKKTFTAIDEILGRKKLPIIVGGSPFYVYSVTEGWQFPKVEKDERLRKRLNKLSLLELQNVLRKIDPAAFEKIDQNNPRRLVRAIEVCTISGRDFEKSKPTSKPKYNFLFLGIKFSNEELKRRIMERTKNQLREGMIEEVRKTIDKKQASYSDLEKLGLETRLVAMHLRNKINKKELEDLLVKNVYHFAKRQMSWFRKDKRIEWVKDMDKAEKKVKKFLARE